MPKRANDDDDLPDVDEALLGLGGTANRNKRAATKKKSNVQGWDDSDEGENDEEWGEKSKGKKSGRKRGRKVHSDDEDEDSDESDDNDSDDKDSTSEDDDDGDDDDAEDDEEAPFTHKYGEDLFENEDDKMRVMSMTERDREELLFERDQERQLAFDKWKLKSSITSKKQQHKKSKEQNKRVQKRSSTRSSKRDTTTSEKSDRQGALDKIKRGRQKKKTQEDRISSEEEEFEIAQPERQKKQQQDKRPFRESVDTDDDNEPAANEPPITCQDLNLIRLSRDRLAHWVFEPFFEAAAIKSYARLYIGDNQGKPTYRVVEITGISTGPPYNVGTRKTNKYLNVRHGHETRKFKINKISNQAFTESEFNKWKSTLEKDSMDMPSKTQVKKRLHESKAASKHVYTDQEIAAIVEEKNKWRGTTNFARDSMTLQEQIQKFASKIKQLKAEKLQQASAIVNMDQDDEDDLAGVNERRLGDLDAQIKDFESQIEKLQEKLAAAEAKVKAEFAARAKQESVAISVNEKLRQKDLEEKSHAWDIVTKRQLSGQMLADERRKTRPQMLGMNESSTNMPPAAAVPSTPTPAPAADEVRDVVSTPANAPKPKVIQQSLAEIHDFKVTLPLPVGELQRSANATQLLKKIVPDPLADKRSATMAALLGV